MKNVVITGSTRGIGYGMAEEFLKRGHAVVISGRSQASVDHAVDKLAAVYDASRILGQLCDMTQYDQIDALWQAAVARYGRVDMWINNAGIAPAHYTPWDIPFDQVVSTITTNVNGMIAASQIAMRGMLGQSSGQIYNMEGFGSDGRFREGMSIYGTTKAALRYFTRSFAKEAAATPVQVGTISPGMVVTDLLVGNIQEDPEAFEKAKRIFNILADRVETVTPWLVDQMLSNEKNGAVINWLTTPKIIGRFLSAPFNKRDLFTD